MSEASSAGSPGGGEPEPARRKSRHPVWPGLVIAAAVFALFWQVFLLDQTIFAGDTAFVFIPFRHYLVERLSHGQLPLWNPYIFGGTPSLAEAQYQLFYPPNLLLFLLGVPRGMAWLLPFHLAWMAVGTYLFARQAIRMGHRPALLAALCFALGGCIQSRLAVPVYTEAAAWMPWLLLTYHWAIRRRGPGILLPGLVVALQLVTGAPQYTYYSLCLLLAYHLFTWFGQRGSGSRQARAPERGANSWLVFGVALGVGIFLAAAQILPEYELALQSDRGTHSTYEYATTFSLVFRHLAATMLFPKFWGSFTSAPLDNYFPGEERGYLGVEILPFLAAAFLSRWRRPALFWAAIALLSIALALGANNPLYPLLYRRIPGLAMFRAPARWLLVTSFAGSLLAAMGLASVLQGPNRARAWMASVGTAAVLLMVSVVLLLTPWGEPAFQTAQKPYGPWGQPALLAVTIVCLAMLRPEGSSLARKRSLALLLGMLVFDLIAVSLDMELQGTLTVRTMPNDSVVLQQLRPTSDRFWSWNDNVPLEEWLADKQYVFRPGEFRNGMAGIACSRLPSCSAAEYRVYGLTGAWGALMPLRRHLQPLYEGQTPDTIRLRWLRLMNVAYHLGVPQMIAGGMQSRGGDEATTTHYDPDALPRAFLVPSARSVEPGQVMTAMSAPAFDPRHEAIVEGAAEPTTAGTFIPAHLRTLRPERVELDVDSPARQWLVLMDSVYPGWQATIDGTPASFCLVFWVGRGVFVPAGHHTVKFEFRPASVRVGLFLSLATLLGMLGFAIATRRAPSKSRRHGAAGTA